MRLSRSTVITLSTVALGAAGIGAVAYADELANTASKSTLIAPYRSGKPARLVASVDCPTATGAAHAADPAQDHGPFICFA